MVTMEMMGIHFVVLGRVSRTDRPLRPVMLSAAALTSSMEPVSTQRMASTLVGILQRKLSFCVGGSNRKNCLYFKTLSIVV